MDRAPDREFAPKVPAQAPSLTILGRALRRQGRPAAAPFGSPPATPELLRRLQLARRPG